MTKAVAVLYVLAGAYLFTAGSFMIASCMLGVSALALVLGGMASVKGRREAKLAIEVEEIRARDLAA